MTPSEKKAREILPDCYKDSRLLRSRIASALSEAERRGFERATELAAEYCYNLGQGFISKGIENLKYEDA